MGEALIGDKTSLVSGTARGEHETSWLAPIPPTVLPLVVLLGDDHLYKPDEARSGGDFDLAWSNSSGV